MSRWRFFFFQAEDGIRDTSVTGVQTCALPICLQLADCWMFSDLVGYVHVDLTQCDGRWCSRGIASQGKVSLEVENVRFRSEERRVGKECGVVRASDSEERRTLQHIRDIADDIL